MEDALTFHLRPKVELYEGDVRLVILRTTRYDEEAEEVDFGEISVFAGADLLTAQGSHRLLPRGPSAPGCARRHRARAASEVQPYLRDVQNTLLLVNEEVAAQRDALGTVLEANMAVLSVEHSRTTSAPIR